MAFSTFTNQPLSIEMAQDALKICWRCIQKLVNTGSIQKTVAEYSKYGYIGFAGKKRTPFRLPSKTNKRMALAKNSPVTALPGNCWIAL